MSASYPLVRNRRAFSTRFGVLSNPSRLGSSPSSTSNRSMRSCITLFYCRLANIKCLDDCRNSLTATDARRGGPHFRLRRDSSSSVSNKRASRPEQMAGAIAPPLTLTDRWGQILLDREILRGKRSFTRSSRDLASAGGSWPAPDGSRAQDRPIRDGSTPTAAQSTIGRSAAGRADRRPDRTRNQRRPGVDDAARVASGDRTVLLEGGQQRAKPSSVVVGRMLDRRERRRGPSSSRSRPARSSTRRPSDHARAASS